MSEKLSVRQVAEMISYSERRVRDLLAERKIKGFKLGRKWLIPEDELERYLKRTDIESDKDKGGWIAGFGGYVSQSSRDSGVEFDMKKHRNDLLDPVIPELKGIDVFGALDSGLATWYARPHETSWPIARGKVERRNGGRLAIRLFVEEKLEWAYLRQHLQNDELWTAIDAWKRTMTRDIGLRLTLLGQIVRRIESGTGLKVSELGSAGKGSGIDIYYAYSIYDQVFCKVIGIRLGLIQKDQFAFDAPNTMRLGGQPVIRHQDANMRTKAVDFFLDAETSLVDLPEAGKAKNAYEDAQQKTEEVKRHADRIRLTVAFLQGSACDACRQYVASLR
jgi:excisionase family DNA binding protein